MNKGLQTTLDHKHHSISAKLDAPFSNAGKTLVVQFSVKHELKEYVFCGGGYIKLHPPGLQQQSYGGDDKYNIMFGPDLCGYDVSRIHLIFTDHLGKNHERKPELKMDYEDKDEYTHLYTLILQPDQSYTVLIDNTKKSSGSLWDHYGFTKKTRDDPSDPKPSDWVDVAEILDPDDVKPDDWDLDHSERMVDPESAMPDDWDVDIDGDWHPATINNPDYKGPWRQKKIPNPEYKGPWKPTQLLNEHYDEGVGVYIDNAYVGFELWTVNHGSIFDNILITDDVELAKKEGACFVRPFQRSVLYRNCVAKCVCVRVRVRMRVCMCAFVYRERARERREEGEGRGRRGGARECKRQSCLCKREERMPTRITPSETCNCNCMTTGCACKGRSCKPLGTERSKQRGTG